MKKAVTKVIDTLTQEDFREAFQKLLEQYNKCIATGGKYFVCTSYVYILTFNVFSIKLLVIIFLKFQTSTQ